MELKKANNSWSECIAKTFLPMWLAGESVNIEEACPNETSKMQELDEGLYAEKPMPFKAQF